VEHVGLRPEDVPILLTYPVPTLAAINSGKVKRTVDIGVCVSEIKKMMEWKMFVMPGVSLGRIGGADEVCV
jgi:hypothetical protein